MFSEGVIYLYYFNDFFVWKLLKSEASFSGSFYMEYENHSIFASFEKEMFLYTELFGTILVFINFGTFIIEMFFYAELFGTIQFSIIFCMENDENQIICYF